MTPDLIVKATAILAAALALRWFLGRRSAALRHLVLAMALGAVVLLPLASTVVPVWRVPLLAPREQAQPTPIATPAATRTDVVTPEPAIRPAGPALPPLEMLAILWAAGVALVLGWCAVGHAGLARMRRGGHALDDAEWTGLLYQAAMVPGQAERVQLYRSPRVSSPVTWGIFRTIVLLPDAAVTWPLARRRAVLSHELAHAMRGDSVAQLVGVFACALYWFHPLAWMAWRGLRVESERSCDDVVVSRGTPATEYATHLLDVARLARVMRLGGMTAIGMARPSHLEGRLLAILDDARNRWDPPRGVRAAAWTSLAVIAWPMAAFSPAHRTASPAATPPALGTIANAPVSPIDSVFERTFTARSGGRLDLELETGATVHITGWDEPSVHVRGRLSGPSARNSTAEFLQRDGNLLIALSQEESSNVTSTSHRLDLKVPRRYDVHIRSAGGDVTITDMEGEFTGRTGGGEIYIDRVKGSTSLSTGGGDIRVSNSALDGRVSTGGGLVQFRQVTGNVKGSSGSGPVIRGGPDDGGGPISMEKAGGDIYLAEAPEGADVRTGGGKIRIGAASGAVRASTGGGDIDIGPISGTVYAGTGAGDVTVRIARLSAGDPAVEISAGVGAVTLELPSGLSATLDIQTGYTRSTRRRPTIEADWTLEREETSEWDGREGTPRRYLRARGDIGGGGPVIKVRTLNGNVTIRRR